MFVHVENEEKGIILKIIYLLVYNTENKFIRLAWSLSWMRPLKATLVRLSLGNPSSMYRFMSL